MIKYSSDIEETEIRKKIKEEIKYIDAFVTFQKNLKEYISSNFDAISLMNSNDPKFQDTLKNLVPKVFEIRISLDCNNIKLQSLLQSLKFLKHCPSESLKMDIKKYNQDRKKAFVDITPNTKKAKKIAFKIRKILKDNTEPTKQDSILSVPFFELSHISDNYTLKISEKTQQVYLPFLVKDLKEILNNNPNKYSSMKDLIDKKYTVPLKYYQNSSYARFKEAYKLVREREHGSINQALNLAFELIFNYNLNPAVISACKNVDELDIYLDCLEDNELDQFYCFEIVYEIPPTIVKNKKEKNNDKNINVA